MKTKGESSSAPVQIDDFSGNGIFVQVVRPDPEIPESHGRICTQCGKTAWALSRWCWHCKYDFERAAIPRFHPAKLLYLSLALNAGACAAIALMMLA